MDLNAPIGKAKPQRSGRRAAIAAAVVGVGAVLGTLAFLLWTANPHGGEPYAVATIPALVEPRPAPQPATDPTPTGSIGAVGDGDIVRIEHGVKIVSPRATNPAQRGAGPAVIDVSRAVDEAARRSDAAKATPADEASAPAGETIARTEETPPAVAAPAAERKPRIAIFIGGMGLDPRATRTATEIMPSAVDLAFLPGPNDPAEAVAAARARGHEVLLQLPMQTTSGAAGPPHMLRSDEAPSELAADLDWMMKRFSGYAGVANLLGAPVMSRQASMNVVLTAVGKRGLFFLDDGTARETGVAALSRRLGVEALRADVVLDATADPAVVKSNLAKLADIARSRGTAIGMASGLPDHLATIASFANEARNQGLDLVPMSALVGNAAHLATSR